MDPRTGGTGTGPPGTRPVRRNRDADWNAWPVADYLAENYRSLHPCDIGVIRHHAAVYRRCAPAAWPAPSNSGRAPTSTR